MALKSCKSGEVHYNPDEYIRQRLAPWEDPGPRCKRLRVPGWLIQAVINSNRNLKAVDLVCLNIQTLFIYGRKLDFFRIADSQIDNFTLRFSEISSAFIFENSAIGNYFEVRWNTFNDIYLRRMTTMSFSGWEFFGIQNNQVGNGLEINDMDFGRKPDEGNEQHNAAMLVLSNRIGAELAVVDSTVNGGLNLFDTTATSVRIDNSVVAGALGIDSASAEKGIFVRNSIAGGGVQGHYLHADGIEFRFFGSVGRVDLRSSQFADKILFDNSVVDEVFLHDVVTRPLLIYNTRVGVFEMEGFKSSLVVASSSGPPVYGNSVGRLSLNDSSIENTIQIDNTAFSNILAITNTQVGSSLAVEGQRAVFVDGAQLDIRGMKTDGLNIDLDVLKTANRKGERDKPLRIKSDGAAFNRFGSFSETGADLSDLPVPQLLRHFALADDGNYRAEEFDQLAAVLEKSGRGDKSRDIKIEKNRAYARASDSRLTSSIYTVAGFVNGYGYDNEFALLLYFACVLVGMVLFWIWLNARPIALCGRVMRRPATTWRRRALLRRIGMLRRRNLQPSPGALLSVHRRNGGLIYAFFFSLDRSLPPLNLDSAFATQEGMWRPLAYWFFFQRAFCFLVISLVVAGSLGMFQ
jgi:hypothetical protein